MQRMQHRSVVMAAACLVSVGGCYSYTPVALDAAPSEQPVRVYFTPSGAERLAPLLGDGPTAVDGLLESRGDSSIVMSVTAVQRTDRDAQPWTGERVTLPSVAVDRIVIRRLDRTRTTIASIAVGGVLLLARSLFTGSENTGVRPGGGPGSGK